MSGQWIYGVEGHRDCAGPSVGGMRRVVSTLAVLAMVGAVAYMWQANAKEPSCRTTLRYDGVSYAVYEVTEEIQAVNMLGVGTERGCGDKGPWRREVAVSRIRGVEPGTALVTPAAARVLYVAEGVTVNELPSDIAALVAPQP